MMSFDLERVRLDFAEKIREISGLRSSSLVRAFATVPREQFVGPGPWKILRPPDLERYEITPDDDPRHLYDTVLVALDAGRHLNNGEPASLARWLDDLDLVPGDRFLHIGCGVGYYTAIAAEAVSPGGSAVGLEIDPWLAERARRNLGAFEHVEVTSTDGSEYAGEPFDAIFVNAGATELQRSWLDLLRAGGRLLVPLTVALPVNEAGVGHMLRVVRQPNGYAARFVSPVGIFHCAGARTEDGNDLLRQAYSHGGQECVRSLIRDEHPSNPQCWLHTPRFCLSRLSHSGCRPTMA